ncbi:uridine phosphorylase [Thermohydrogenium kirishiense]|nr:uridine phosphorylase [Thermohydrogenium kirishiense]
MVYEIQPHIRFGIDESADYAILPGDPKRVERVKEFLENTKDVAYNREFKTVSGFYKGVKILVTSTGIGGPSLGIAVEELKNLGVKAMIRIGSCGALQPNIKLGDLVMALGAVRDEGTSVTYIEKSYPAVPDNYLLENIIESAKSLGATYHCGIIRSHDSFYTDKEDEIDRFWSTKGVLAADMESAPLFVIGRLRGIKTASILNVVVAYEGNLEEGINEYVDGKDAVALGEEREILTALEAIVRLNR